MSIRRTKINNSFTILPNSLLNDKRLGYKELGLLVYLLSKPENWEVMAECLAKERDISVDTVYRYLKTIRECGYASYTRNSDGTTDWIVSDVIMTEDDDEEEKASRAMPVLENDDVLIRTDIKKRNELNNNNKKSEKTLSDYLIECRESGNKPIPDDDPIFEYARKVGIPDEYLGLGWVEFKRLQKQDKKQKDWKAVFRDYVRREFLKIWYFDREDNCRLTSKGIQLQRELS